MSNPDDDFFESVGKSASPSRRRSGSADEPTAAASTLTKEGAPGASTVTGVRRWAANDNIFWAAKATYDELPPGLYRCNNAPEIGYFVDKQSIDTDSLLILPDNSSTEIVDEFKTFWTLKAEFDKRGFLHKRGVLLWGPPGSGKTSLIQILIQIIVKDMNGIVVFIDHPKIASGCLQMIRKVEPNRPLICVMEDLDALIDKHGENEYLAMLDGEAQVDNVVYVATTNYPEKLDRRFVDRPSRFDRIRWIGMPSAAARREYLKVKEPSLEGAELEEWVEASRGFSVAHLREMIISCRCFKHPLKDVVERLEKMKARKPSSDDAPDKEQVGITTEKKKEAGFGFTGG